MTWNRAAGMTLVFATALGAQPCARLDMPWWQVGATRFYQGSGEGPRSTGIGVERHFVDRRVLRRTAAGYRLDIVRTRLSLRDSTVRIAVDFAPTGAVTAISGDTVALGHDVSPLVMLRCADLQPGRSYVDLGGRVDSVRRPTQQGVSRSMPVRPVTVGAPVDTLGTRLAVVLAQRVVHDSARGQLQRQLPNQAAATVHPWTVLSGEETERQLVRPGDGQVVFREHARKAQGRGWLPPHPDGDTVPVRVETASLDRVVDSATAAGVLAFLRRGELLVSATTRDTVALHYREWRGDTLVVRQVRRSGWRDELRTVWRASQIVSATLIEPGNATQPAGPMRRALRVEKGFLHDAGAKDSVVATPTHAWSIAIDGFEDMLVPALAGIPADSQPHRFSMYGLQDDRGVWLDWSVTIVPRGAVRVARFSTLQRQWVGVFVFTPTGELLLANLGGAQGVTRVPATGTRLATLLDAQQGKIQRDDLLPPSP